MTDRAIELASRALERPGSPFSTLPDRLIVVDVNAQKLVLLEAGRPTFEATVSTSARGIGGASGSYRTPPGWHAILSRIGEGAAIGTVFENRRPTGRIWKGEIGDHDLIITRILTLEGLEEGVNRGAGCDSLERFIYVHATTQESLLGRAASHGCVRLSSAALIELFDRVREGDPVLIAGTGSWLAMPDPFGTGRFHYAGLGGSGMSGLAQFQALAGGRVSGSDRTFDRGERAEGRAQLERLGITIHPQDGSGVTPDCAALVISSAVESEVADVRAARERGVPTIHRAELLAHFVSSRRTIAVAGTSGKSTVVAMVFEILRSAGRDPSLITGGELVSLQREGLMGNAWHGKGECLVIEADESDGSLVQYAPVVGVLLNLQKDHKEIVEIAPLFERFCKQVKGPLLIGDGENLARFAPNAMVFGLGAGAAVRAEAIHIDPHGSRFEVRGVTFRLPVPGRHNIENAIAAIATCHTLAVPLQAMVEPLSRFGGVARRFQSMGTAGGIEVIDDFAHNAEKIRATLAAARLRGRRVLAVYQPHGYAPTRLLRPDFVKVFAEELRADDRLWILEIFYAGGSAVRDFSAADLVAEIAERGSDAEFASSREVLATRIAEEAREGDVVVVMGARDPSLTILAARLLQGLESSQEGPVRRG